MIPLDTSIFELVKGCTGLSLCEYCKGSELGLNWSVGTG